MIIALVQIKLPEPVSLGKATELFEGSAHLYRGMPGLIRKHYVLTEDGATGGGVYLWETRAAAKAVYNAEWRKMIVERYGSEPQVTYFESPVTVDNVAEDALVAAG
ncbi:MAG: monooxygenase [Alphaproteobacteria bacterium]